MNREDFVNRLKLPADNLRFTLFRNLLATVLASALLGGAGTGILHTQNWGYKFCAIIAAVWLVVSIIRTVACVFKLNPVEETTKTEGFE